MNGIKAPTVPWHAHPGSSDRRWVAAMQHHRSLSMGVLTVTESGASVELRHKWSEKAYPFLTGGGGEEGRLIKTGKQLGRRTEILGDSHGLC